MKREYKKPSVEVIGINQAEIICNSPLNIYRSEPESDIEDDMVQW